MHLRMDRTYHESFYIMELKLLIKDLEKGKNNTRKQKNPKTYNTKTLN